jgi:hypothetical protein
MARQRLILRQTLQQKRFSRPFAATPDTVEFRPAFQSLQPQQRYLSSRRSEQDQ